MNTTATDPARRATPLKMTLKDKGQLYAAYISAFTQGGIFVPSTRSWTLGEDVMLSLTLPDSTEPHMLPATVAWITPENAPNHRKPGVGVMFADDLACQAVRSTIESMLGSALQSEKLNLTL